MARLGLVDSSRSSHGGYGKADVGNVYDNVRANVGGNVTSNVHMHGNVGANIARRGAHCQCQGGGNCGGSFREVIEEEEEDAAKLRRML